MTTIMPMKSDFVQTSVECCVWGRCQVTSYVSNTHDPQPQHSPMLNDGTYTAHNALRMCEVVSGESFGHTHADFSFQSPQRSTRNRNPHIRPSRGFSRPTSAPATAPTDVDHSRATPIRRY